MMDRTTGKIFRTFFKSSNVLMKPRFLLWVRYFLLATPFLSDFSPGKPKWPTSDGVSSKIQFVLYELSNFSFSTDSASAEYMIPCEYCDVQILHTVYADHIVSHQKSLFLFMRVLTLFWNRSQWSAFKFVYIIFVKKTYNSDNVEL